MNRFNRAFVLAVALAGASVTSRSIALGAPRKAAWPVASHHGEVVDAENLFISGPWRPSALLATALNKHPVAQKITVVWNSSGPGSASPCSAVYDRRTRTLLLWSYSSDARVDDKTNIEIEQTSEQVWKYSGVTDVILKKLAKKNASNYDGEDASLGYFPQLRQFGCHERKIKNLKRTIRKRMPR